MLVKKPGYFFLREYCKLMNVTQLKSGSILNIEQLQIIMYACLRGKYLLK
jgi:hypothetical protein